MAINNSPSPSLPVANPQDVVATASATLDALPLGVVVLDRDCNVVSWNTEAKHLVGEPKPQADGRRRFEPRHHDGTPCDVSLLLDADARTERDVGRQWRVELLDPDGVPRVLDVLVASMQGDRTVAVFHDVTAEHAAEQRRQRTNTQVQRLHEIVTSLAPVRTTAEVLDIVLDQVVGGVGAAAGSAAVTVEGGRRLEVVAATGYSQDVVQQYKTFSIDADVPLAAAARSGETIVLRSIDDVQQSFPTIVETVRQGGYASWASVPLVGEGGTIGAIGLSFDGPREFDDDEFAFLRSIGTHCAIALDRTRMAESEAAAHAEAEAARARMAFLADMAHVLASSLDPQCTIENVAATAIPRLGDVCLVSLVDGRGELRPRALADVDPDEERRLEQMAARWTDHRTTSIGPQAVALSGRSELYPTVSDEFLARFAVDEEHMAALRTLGLSSAMVVPLRARGRPIGTLTTATRHGRFLDADDLELARAAGNRAGIAIENARLYAEGLRQSEQLQRSLLPPRLPTIPGLQLGTSYAAAGVGVDVGGDFYDVVDLDDGGWLFVIGDVRGKGIDAAAVTGLARHTIRAVAAIASSPAEILRHLDKALRRADAERLDAEAEPRFATVCVVTVVPHAGGAHVKICSGGHPLPLLRRSHGHVTPVGRPGTALGMIDELELEEVETTLGHGDALVCVTDGLLERREGNRLFEDRLPGLLAAAGHDADALAAYLREAAEQHSTTPPSDDMAVLVIRVPS